MISKLRGKIFYGWWVLIACAAIQFYIGGTFFQGFTALFNPLASEFNWSYALVSLAFTARGFEMGIVAPVVGFLVDKFGPRRLVFAGVIVSALGFFLFSRIQSLWSFYAVFLILSIGLALSSPIVCMSAITMWFKDHKRSTFAMGLLTTGFGLSGLLVPAVVWLVDRSDWREAVIIFGIGAVLLGVPLSFLVKLPPDQEPLPQKRKSPSDSAEVSRKPDEPRVWDTLKKKEFWLLSVAVLFAGVAGMAVIVHLIPYMVSLSISRSTASLLVVVLSLSNTAGRLLFGWLGDIYDKRYCFVTASLLKGIGVFGLALGSTVGHFIPAIIALGLGFGGVVPLRPALQVQFFGTKNFGSIQGLLIALINVGGILSPPFAGWVFDTWGNYRPAFIVLAAATMLAVPTVLAVPKASRTPVVAKTGS
ncbi:MAG: MFS transporter [Chloroflexi bacterium]|nr:MFS transporter [Chloroflexota bacterium]